MAEKKRRQRSIRGSDPEYNAEALRLQADPVARADFRRSVLKDTADAGPGQAADAELQLRAQDARHRKHGWGEGYSAGVSKERGYKQGGAVRGDGCATKGKTRGRVC